jgi:hypothetical protein
VLRWLQYAAARHFVIEQRPMRAVPWVYIDPHQSVTDSSAKLAEIFRQRFHFVCVRKHLRAQPNKSQRVAKLQK